MNMTAKNYISGRLEYEALKVKASLEDTICGMREARDASLKRLQESFLKDKTTKAFMKQLYAAIGFQFYNPTSRTNPNFSTKTDRGLESKVMDDMRLWWDKYSAAYNATADDKQMQYVKAAKLIDEVLLRYKDQIILGDTTSDTLNKAIAEMMSIVSKYK